MTSAINPNLIDIAYPIAGQDNDTQGFRDNFADIQTNFTTAATEITAIQTSQAIIDGTNDFGGNIIQDAEFLDNSLTVNNIGPSIGTVTLDHTAGHVAVVSMTGAITLAFSGWPVVGKMGSILLELTVSSGYSVGLPVEVVTPPDFVMAADGNATYWYEFVTRDEGATIYLYDKTRSYGLNTGNLDISGNTISSTNTNGDINITPHGTGSVIISSLTIGVVSFTDNTISTNNTNSDLELDPAGTGAVIVKTSELHVTEDTTSTSAHTIISHSDNTSTTSHARLTLESGGASGGNSYISTNVTGGSIGWSFGLDNLDNDKFKIARDTNDIITNVAMEISQTNNFTFNGAILTTSTLAAQATTVTSLTATGDISGTDVAISGNIISTLNTNQDIELSPAGTGTLDVRIPTQGTIGANGAASALTANPVGYININVGGVPYIMPYYNP